jgi:hypothetical protein
MVAKRQNDPTDGGRHAMLNSRMGERSDSANRPLSALVPTRSARRLYRILESSVLRLLKSSANTSALPARTDSAGRSSRAEPASVVRPVLQRLSGDRTPPDDAKVREWKRTWISGAESRWAGTSLLLNPHDPGSSRAAAWRAGWHWAEDQPDRRHPDVVRFAHPHRRRADRSSRLVRSAQAGAVGLSVLTIAAWLWQIRRKKPRSGD